MVSTEQVPSPTDLEVAHGDLEAAAKVGVLADGAKALVRRLGEHLVMRVEQVRVGTLTRATDPTAQLVELAEAEKISAGHHQRVDAGHVDA